MTRPTLIGVSLKMYFTLARAQAYAQHVRTAAQVPAITQGRVELFIAPSHAALAPLAQALEGASVQLAAQNVSAHDLGAHTGEVSAAELVELGVRYVEVGHAERRRMHHEDDVVVAAKTAAVVRAGMVPLICLGEEHQTSPVTAANQVVDQLERALADLVDSEALAEVVVAYEPVWAIGAERPAPAAHVSAVTAALTARLHQRGQVTSRVIYGGSAGPGLLTVLGHAVDGLFLGRFVHDPAALSAVLAEADAHHRSADAEALTGAPAGARP